NHSQKRLSKDDIEEITKYVKKHLGEYSALFVDWFGGEPMLEKQSITYLSELFIEESRKRGKLYFSSMTTNGLLLDVDSFKCMIENKVSSFQITLDGLKNTHNFTRPLLGGGGSFEKIILNLRNIRDNVRGRFNIIIRTNVNIEVLEQIEDYLAFLNKEFGKDDRFLFYFRPVGDWGGENVRQLGDSMITNLDDLYEKILDSREVLNYRFYWNLLKNSICQAAYRNAYVIVPNAKLLKCTCDLDNENNEIGQLVNGDFCIDQSKLADWIIYDYTEDEKCVSCPQYASCYRNTCPLNRIKGKKYPCGYDNKYINYILKLIIFVETYGGDGCSGGICGYDM
ncbi:MAG: hypothetical protein K2P14_08325, partial [Anaeroplasmataceae bacterium]|nr:hypothetical protein [Anaeroplasmataceae bacterium]